MNKSTIATALSVIEARRRKAEAVAEANAQLLQKDDRWQANDKAIRLCNIDIAKDKLNERDASENKRRLAKLLVERNDLLKKHNMTSKDLVARYSCPLCNDTGYVKGNKCQCLRREVTKLLSGNCGYVDDSCTFENSTETNPDNLKTMEICRTFSKKLNDTRFRIVVLLGKTGTGKTYLCNAMANEALKNLNSVFVITAYRLSELFLQCHLSSQEEKLTVLEDLMDTDLLVIDDLGVENTFSNVTSEYLFALINERIQRGNKTVISSNLTVAQIRDRYDERIFSRIADRKLSIVAKLTGNDKRISEPTKK